MLWVVHEKNKKGIGAHMSHVYIYVNLLCPAENLVLFPEAL